MVKRSRPRSGSILDRLLRVAGVSLRRLMQRWSLRLMAGYAPISPVYSNFLRTSSGMLSTTGGRMSRFLSVKLKTGSTWPMTGPESRRRIVIRYLKTGLRLLVMAQGLDWLSCKKSCTLTGGKSRLLRHGALARASRLRGSKSSGKGLGTQVPASLTVVRTVSTNRGESPEFQRAEDM